MSGTNMRQATTDGATTATTDVADPRLTLGRRVRAWFARRSFEVILTVGFGLLWSQIADLRADMREDRSNLEGRIESVRTDLETKIESVRTDLEAKIESVRTDLEVKIEMETGNTRREIINLIQAYHGQPPRGENEGQ